MKEKGDLRPLARVVGRLGQITGFGLSLVTPVFLLVWGALWLEERFGLGDWVMVLAIVAGLLSAGCTFYRFVRAEVRLANRESEAYLREKAERGNGQERPPDPNGLPDPNGGEEEEGGHGT